MSLLHSKISLGGISHTFIHTNACRHTDMVGIFKKQEKSSFRSIMSEERQNQHMYCLLKNKKYLIQVTERFSSFCYCWVCCSCYFSCFFFCLFVLWRFVRELWDRFNGSWGRKQKKKKTATENYAIVQNESGKQKKRIAVMGITWM